MNEDERAIRGLVDSWMVATRAGDMESVLDLMADDVIFTVPGREPFGKEQFKAQSQSLAGVEMDGRSDIQEVEVCGDWAWIRNRIEIAITPPGGEAVHRSGYTLTILKKCEDGKWRLFRDANLLT